MSENTKLLGKIIFQLGTKYTRKEIQDLLEVPETRRNGNWLTGYTRYNGDYFLFVNIGVPGRTGHDYKNKLLKSGELLWYGKNGSQLRHDSIKKMIIPINKRRGRIFVFIRDDNQPSFTFYGEASCKKYFEKVPVEIIWEFPNRGTRVGSPLLGNRGSEEELFEGTPKNIDIKRYERNKEGRSLCIKAYGYRCSVCGISMEDIYGEIGKNFIHIHHIAEISSIGHEYKLDPVKDLRPVCPNCHEMLHRRVPAYSIKELKNIMAYKIAKE